MNKFDMGAAWADAVTMLSANKESLLVLGGLLLAVPYAFLFVTFSQSDFLSQFRPEMTAMELISVLGSLIWIGLAIYLISEIGSLAITRLLLASGGTTVGEALKFALIFVLISIAANIIIALGIQLPQLLAETIFPDNAVVSLIIGLTMLALSLYLNSGRFAAAIPAIAAKEIRNPLRALKTSWDVTVANGWRVALFVILTTFLLVLTLGLAALILALILAVLPTAVGGVLLWIPVGFAAAAITVINLAIRASIYRQLCGGWTAGLSEEFS